MNRNRKKAAAGESEDVGMAGENTNREREMLNFASDYLEGAHPAILKRLEETNFVKTPGYGLDAYSEAARDLIREACGAPEAAVWFLTGGTQTNAVVIDALLRSYQGAVCAETGHIQLHEAGAIEFGGHKVMPIAHREGKITAETLDAFLKAFREDENHEHMVMPGMVYISQPTEYGTLYSRSELEALHRVCRGAGIPLYADGARLAYALGSRENDVTLSDLAKYCDAFYIGGTKCGALFGEALVLPRKDTVTHLLTIVKQHGALLAKGRIAALQFEVLFTDGLYEKLGAAADAAADRIRDAARAEGYTMVPETATNQIFLKLHAEDAERLRKQIVMSFWEKTPDGDTVYRIATSWATREEDTDRLIRVLKRR